MYSLNARDHFYCSPLLFHDQHHETDAAKWKGGLLTGTFPNILVVAPYSLLLMAFV